MDNNENEFAKRITVYLGQLLERVTKMLKKVTLDDELSKVLDDFMQKLHECDVYLANGIFNTNFAEAALLLQNSVELYGKKVDMLWEVIVDYRKHVALFDDKNKNSKEHELENVEERKRKHKRKKKPNDEGLTKEVLSNFSFNATDAHDYINTEIEQSNLISAWDVYCTAPDDSNMNNELYENKSTLFLPQDQLYNLDDNELVGRYDQFHFPSVMNEIISNSENCDVETKNQKSIDNTNLSICSFDSGNDESFLCHSKENDTQNQECNNEQNSSKNCDNGCLDKTLDSGINDTSRRLSTADSVMDSHELTADISEHHENSENIECSQSSINDGEQAKSIEKRNKSVSQDSAFYDADDLDDLTSHPDTSLGKNALCAGSSIVIPSKTMTPLKTSDLKRPTNPKDDKEGDDPPVKRRRISAKRILKLITGVTVNLKKFESFYYNHYEYGDEGIPERPEFLDEESDDDDDNNADQLPISDSVLPEESIATLAETTRANELLESEQQPEDDAIAETVEQSEAHDVSRTEEVSLRELQAKEQSKENVRKWRSFIKPKLLDIQQRNSFDIHKYGSQIMEPAEVGETRYFKDIVKNQTPDEVARHFLAILQLGSTGNIDLTNIVPGELSNDSLKITVMDKSRYHEFLDDFQAPSEETFKHRLEQVKAMNPNVMMHSTPAGPPSPKKIKIMKKFTRVDFNNF